jgi:two-component system sensor histidine kinase CiaH
VVSKNDGILLYKRIRPENPNEQIIFLRKSGYPLEDLLRDILRFIILDILIIIPFYFMGRYFVRKTLEPVEENMSAMSHFIHDAGHELKTPLAIISGNLQILRESKKPDSTLVEESIKTIHDMSGALDGLLELSNLKK